MYFRRNSQQLCRQGKKKVSQGPRDVWKTTVPTHLSRETREWWSRSEFFIPYLIFLNSVCLTPRNIHDIHIFRGMPRGTRSLRVNSRPMSGWLARLALGRVHRDIDTPVESISHGFSLCLNYIPLMCRSRAWKSPWDEMIRITREIERMTLFFIRPSASTICLERKF